jgi:hypothetical protein
MAKNDKNQQFSGCHGNKSDFFHVFSFDPDST